MSGARRITAAEYLKTLELYLELASVSQVASQLGLSGNTVWNRLVRLSCMVPPASPRTTLLILKDPANAQAVRENLEYDILPRDANERNRAPRVSAADRLKTLDLYLKHQSITKVAELLGISYPSARSRLLKLGLILQPRAKATKTVAELNDMAKIARIRRQLQAGVNVRHEQAHVVQGQISAADLLRILDLYLELQGAQRVADAVRTSAKSVRQHLHQLGIVMLGPGPKKKGAVMKANGEEHVAIIRLQLAEQAFAEAVTGLSDPI